MGPLDINLAYSFTESICFCEVGKIHLKFTLVPFHKCIVMQPMYRSQAILC